MKGSSTQLPPFIDRIKEVNFLINLGLIEFITSKHIHLKHTKFTKKGLKIYEELKNLGINTIFEKIPLSSEYAFKGQYYEKLEEIQKYFKYPESEIYKLLFNKINKWLKPNNIEFRVDKVLPIEIQDNDEKIKISYQIKCCGCNNTISQEIEIIYNFKLKMDPITIKCGLCSETYKFCPYFNCLYSISN